MRKRTMSTSFVRTCMTVLVVLTVELVELVDTVVLGAPFLVAPEVRNSETAATVKLSVPTMKAMARLRPPAMLAVLRILRHRLSELQIWPRDCILSVSGLPGQPSRQGAPVFLIL